MRGEVRDDWESSQGTVVAERIVEPLQSPVLPPHFSVPVDEGRVGGYVARTWNP